MGTVFSSVVLCILIRKVRDMIYLFRKLIHDIAWMAICCKSKSVYQIMSRLFSFCQVVEPTVYLYAETPECQKYQYSIFQRRQFSHH